MKMELVVVWSFVRWCGLYRNSLLPVLCGMKCFKEHFVLLCDKVVLLSLFGDTLSFVIVLNLQLLDFCGLSKPAAKWHNYAFERFFFEGDNNGRRMHMTSSFAECHFHRFSVPMGFCWTITFVRPWSLCLSSQNPTPNNMTLLLSSQLAKFYWANIY